MNLKKTCVLRARVWVLGWMMCCAWLQAQAEIISIDPRELQKLMSAGVKVVDVRTPQEWQQTGVIAGAQLVTYSNALGVVDEPAFVQDILRKAPPQDAVILVCRSGNRSLRAAQLLEREGKYTKIYNLEEGMNGWLRNKQPVQKLPGN